MNSNLSLTKLSPVKLLSWIMSGVALIGLADSLYLAVEHYLGASIPCYITEGCDTVLRSSYSQVFGIPLAAFGILFYAGMFLLVNSADLFRNANKLILFGGIVGFMASLTFLYLQVYVIGALCFYCLISLGTSTTLFILSVLLYRKTGIQDQLQRVSD